MSFSAINARFKIHLARINYFALGLRVLLK
jgi:hypothetical protein